MLAAGAPYRVICSEIGCTKATVSRYAGQMGLRKSKRKHDWRTIRLFYESGHSGRATRRKFDVNAKTWQDAIRRGDIIPRPPRAHIRTVEELISAPSVRRTLLKARLIREGFLDPRCAFCGIHSWRGQQLNLELDHINGAPRDNRLANLRLLCPNCHSQTETFSGRNASAKRPLRQLRNGDTAALLAGIPELSGAL